MRQLLRRRSLAVLLLAVACSDSSGPGDAPSLPASFQLTATAAAAYPDGSTVDCAFHLLITLGSEASGGIGRVYTGSMAGESSRFVLAADGSGLGFHASMAWPTSEARLIGADSMEFRLSDPDPTSRFWNSFSLLAGARDPAGNWSGTWTCFPFDITSGGYTDTSLTAVGRWDLEVD